MTPEHAELFKKPKQVRVLEKRSALLTAFLAEHGIAEPKSVEYAPLPGCSRINCFRNVEAQVRRAGGRMETGWMFWEYIDLCIKSEAHAIWITPQGKRHDITPQDIYPDRRLLFTPDPQVAVKRGYTAFVKTILTLDPLLASVERFDTAFHNLLSKHFTSFGS